MAIKNVAGLTFRDARLEIGLNGSKTDFKELGGISGFQYSGSEAGVQTFRHWNGKIEHLDDPEIGDVVLTAPWLAHMPIWKDLYAARADRTLRTVQLTTKKETLFTAGQSLSLSISSTGVVTLKDSGPSLEQMPYGSVLKVVKDSGFEYLPVIGVKEAKPVVHLGEASSGSRTVSSVEVPAVRIGPFEARCRTISGPTETDGMLIAEITLRPIKALGAPTMVSA